VKWLPGLIRAAVVIALVAVAFLFVRHNMPTSEVGEHFTAYALFRDGTRLATSSPVMIAGVRVGEVSRLSIEGGFARVDLRLRDDTNVPIDSWVTKRAESAFGDSYIEIIPTGGEEGAPVARTLQSGDRLEHVMEGASTDTLLRTIARTMPKIDNGLDTIHDFSLTGRHWLAGVAEERIRDADHWLDEGHIEKPLAKAEDAVARFEARVDSAASAVHDARRSVPDRIARFDKGVTGARTNMADFKTGFHDALGKVQSGLDDIDPTVDKMAEVVTAINNGSGEDWKGTLGRLVNDSDVADTLEDGTETIHDASASLDRFKSYLGVRFEESLVSFEPRLYVTAELYSRPDSFYLIELEKGQLGGLPADQLVDNPGTPAFTRTTTINDSIRFTAQFGKVLGGRVRLRGGFKDSTFGAGMDLLADEIRLRLSADVFGSFARTPELKLTGALQVFRTVYIVGGIDDALARPGYLPITIGNTTVPTRFQEVHYGRDYFMGASLTFTDADFALLLRVYGALIVGLL